MSRENVADYLPDEGDRRVFETGYDATPPSIAIVCAIAEIEEKEPTDVDFTLYETLDPDALDALFRDDATRDESREVSIAEFSVSDYRVSIRSDGSISIEAPE